MKVRTNTNSLFESSFNLMPGLAVLTDERLKIIKANETFLKVLNKQLSDSAGQDILRLLDIGETKEKQIREYLSTNLTNPKPICFEIFLRTGSKTVIPAMINTRFFQHEDEIVGLMIINDISDQKRNEPDLENTNEKPQRYLEDTHDIIQSVAPDGSIFYANQKWLDTLGYQVEDLTKLNIVDILRVDQVPHFYNILEQVKQGKYFESIETIFISHDDQEIYFEGNVEGQFEFGKFVAMRGNFRDITSSKTLENKYFRLVSHFPQPIYVIHDGLFTYVNPSFINLTGYTEKELVGMQSLNLVHPEDIAFVHRNGTRTLKSNRPSSYEFRLLKQDGEVRWVMETIISIPYEGKIAALGTLIDFTERKLVEGALEEAKNRYQTLFNSANEPIYLHDMEQRFLEVNDATCKMLEYSRAELLKMTIDKIVSPRFYASLPKEIKLLNENGSSVIESENITRSGKLIPMEINSHIVDFEKKRVGMVISHDISERKQVEKMRKRNEARLESIVKISEFKFSNVVELLEFAVNEIVNLTESKIGFVYRYNKDLKIFSRPIWSTNLLAEFHDNIFGTNLPLDKTGLIGDIVKSRKPVMINFPQQPNALINGFPEGNYTLERFLAIPVFHNKEIMAVFGVANKKEDYDSIDEEQMSLLMESTHNLIVRKKAEDALRESENRYRQLIEMAKDGIIIFNTEGKTVMANPAACDMFGYAEKEFSGLDIANTYLPENRDSVIEISAQLTSHKTFSFERQALHKNKIIFLVEVSISPLSNGLYQEVIRDITLRNKMEQEIKNSEQKYRQLVENQADLVVEIDANGEFLFVNPAFIKLMGKSKEELLSSTMQLLTHYEDMEKTERTADNKGVLYYECRMKTSRGLRWVAWTENAVLNDQCQITTLTCMGRDITESKKAKEDLEKANAQLRELDKLKDNFLSTVSHELRTPLTSIKSFAEILLNYEEDRSTQLEFLGIINDESDRLTRLINEVLDLSKIQAGRMQWKKEELSVVDAIRSVVNTARPLLDNAKLELNVDAPELPTVISDKDRLIQVITNLLGNAIKFTPEKGRITIKAWTENHMVTVAIKDNGIGVAPENHQKIFENFGQVGDVLKDRPKGTGLGLPICKKIIETFGGTIWVESALGEGTTMYFNLPAVNK